MKRVVLISCVSRKLTHRAKAKKLYQGPLFEYSLKYARKLKPDKIYILSALYGLLNLEQEIDPYNVTLSYIPPSKRIHKPDLKVLSKIEAEKWGEKVVGELNSQIDLKNDEIIVLAGQSYIKPLKKAGLNNFLEPFKKDGKLLRQGERVKFLKDNVE